VGAILKILCPRERRVFQSKLGVVQLTPLSTHWVPRKKNKKKGTFFFGHPVYLHGGTEKEEKLTSWGSRSTADIAEYERIN
jgi:hypothetical protein